MSQEVAATATSFAAGPELVQRSIGYVLALTHMATVYTIQKNPGIPISICSGRGAVARLANGEQE
jgi:hypothetical protein